MSCYVEFDRIHRGRKSLSLCGEWTDPRDISGDPTCEICRAELAKTAADVFGAPPVGTQVHTTFPQPAPRLKGARS